MDELPPGINEVDANSVERGYESRDLQMRPLIWLAIGFPALFALICGGLWWLYRAEMTRPMASNDRRSVVIRATSPSDAPPLQPQVGHESLDAWDLRKMRDAENATFAAMGWRLDDRQKRAVVPADVIETVRRRQAASRPAEGAR